MKQKWFFDENDRLVELSKIGDPLEKLNKYINWEDFRGILTKALNKEAKGPGGRPPFDYVMMFKILILQKVNNIADDATEYLIKGRLSFQRFLVGFMRHGSWWKNNLAFPWNLKGRKIIRYDILQIYRKTWKRKHNNLQRKHCRRHFCWRAEAA